MESKRDSGRRVGLVGTFSNAAATPGDGSLENTVTSPRKRSQTISGERVSFESDTRSRVRIPFHFPAEGLTAESTANCQERFPPGKGGSREESLRETRVSSRTKLAR